MQIISLFAGIGGFDLAGHWAGWKTVVTCEIEPFPQKVLKHYWPEAYHHDDIHTLTREVIINNSNWKENEPTIVVGGFPCQPYSMAGKRKGKEDDRHLWPEMLRTIREVRPSWVVGENVFGLINWNEGLVFHEIQADLEAAGYEVWPYVLPAVSVNAPHRRDRIWFVARRRDAAHAQCSDLRPGEAGATTDPDIPGTLRQQENRPLCKDGREVQPHRVQTTKGVDAPGNSDSFSENGNAANGSIQRLERGAGSRVQRGECRSTNSCYEPITPDPSDTRLQRGKKFGGITKDRQESYKQPAGRICTDWQNFPTQPPVCGRNDGLSSQLDGITFPKWRNESIKAYGNAIVPQVAYQIFKAINEYERLCTKE